MRWATFLLLILIVLPGSLLADDIYLNNGVVVRNAVIIEQTDKKVVIQYADGTRTFPTEMVVRIVRVPIVQGRGPYMEQYTPEMLSAPKDDTTSTILTPGKTDRLVPDPAAIPKKGFIRVKSVGSLVAGAGVLALSLNNILTADDLNDAMSANDKLKPTIGVATVDAMNEPLKKQRSRELTIGIIAGVAGVVAILYSLELY